ncbi:TRAP transporter substrate-binding protein [Pseudomonas sp. UBA2684]|uniref:TRAP transporter substrate-binding protein n=1 Tax=Pseudomonas sp. UBA2684 TaxID=1947311 RepID=UPI000E89082D|nr:TRAP transporter substrate-binding protein [Pseudomonas sp. UBA2684]HBX56702.1 C4-dicarboxylate ABC transporter substrate-binding protein [Pseudomonas sp.]|tara:strand:- start:19051 stop:20043 length:993 start_codon:yes stop_codon:yes gene_type:complete
MKSTRTSFRFALSAMACVLGFSALSTQAAERWNMTVEQPDGNFITTVAKEFSKDVEAATAGELQIRIHANSVLFKRPEVKRAVQTGQVQVGDVLMSVLGNEDPIYEVDSVPFLVRNYSEAQKLWEVSRPAVEARLAKQGIKLLYAMPWSPQSIFSKTPISSMDDFKGMKFRAYNPATSRMTELMGAIPTVIQTGEIPQAFSTGMISGMLTSPTTGVDSQAWDFATYYYDVKAFIPKNFVIVNARAFNRLPQDAQQAVLDAAVRAEKRGWEIAQEKTGELVKTLADKGMQVADTAPAAVETGFQQIGQTMVDEWLKKSGADGKAIIDAYQN